MTRREALREVVEKKTRVSHDSAQDPRARVGQYQAHQSNNHSVATCLGAPEIVLFLEDIHLDDSEPFSKWLWSFSPQSE